LEELHSLELPSTRLARLNEELALLEKELQNLEKEDLVPSTKCFGLDSESQLQLKEVEFMRDQLRNIAESEAFKIGEESAL
jgi:hypothetical protein